MGWSPPKKFTVIISFLILVVGISCGLISYGIWDVDLFGLDSLTIGILGIVLCFLSWLVLMLGVLVRGI